jgi:hypothetical protein
MKSDPNRLILTARALPRGQAHAYLTAYGAVLEDENGVRLRAHDGSVTTMRPSDGITEIVNPVVKRLEIVDALLISGYKVVHVGDTTSHIIEFEGGGVFAYLRDATGKVIEMTLSGGARAFIDTKGIVLVYGCPPDR